MDFVNQNVNSTSETTEIYAKKVLAGNIESVRLRIVDAMESVGYDIIEEEPNIIGRRGTKGWGTWYGSADALDYPSTLTVRFKSLGENSTRATFDYLIKHPMLSKGDVNVILQEAKTIAALSKIQSIEKICSVCETESTDDSRFCRNCGAPLTSEQTELEVLRMTAETRAGQTSVMTANVFGAISTILVLLSLIFTASGAFPPRTIIVLLSIGLGGIVLTLISSLFGWNRLKRALKKTQDQNKHVPRTIPQSSETGEFAQMPPKVPVASITEGTTNLLDEDWVKTPEREKIPVSKRRETNNFD
jgi:hypothetical protein